MEWGCHDRRLNRANTTKVGLRKWRGLEPRQLTDGRCWILRAEDTISGNEDIRFNESCGVSDESWYLVRVRRYSGQSCTMPYTLTVDARL